MNWHKYLSEYGFKKKYLSDKSGYWYELNIKTNLINNLHISIEIDKKHITVYAKEPKNLNCRMEYTFAIIHKRLTKSNLKRVLVLFNHLIYES